MSEQNSTSKAATGSPCPVEDPFRIVLTFDPADGDPDDNTAEALAAHLNLQAARMSGAYQGWRIELGS